MRPSLALFSYGHWEIDFIVSKHNSWVLLVCVEKYSKLLKLALLPNRNNDLVNRIITALLKGHVVSSITADILLETGVLLSPKTFSPEQLAAMKEQRAMFWQAIEPDLILLP